MGTEVLAQVKHLPMPARKVRRVIDQVRGLHADKALMVLDFLPTQRHVRSPS